MDTVDYAKAPFGASVLLHEQDINSTQVNGERWKARSAGRVVCTRREGSDVRLWVLDRVRVGPPAGDPRLKPLVHRLARLSVDARFLHDPRNDGLSLDEALGAVQDFENLRHLRFRAKPTPRGLAVMRLPDPVPSGGTFDLHVPLPTAKGGPTSSTVTRRR